MRSVERTTRVKKKPRIGKPARRRAGNTSFEDFCVLIKEYEKADLIDGVIYMCSPEGTGANELFLWLGALMLFYVRAKDLGKVFGTRVAFRLSPDCSPEPDIGFLLKVHASRIHPGFVDGPPDLAIEVVSPESVERDYVDKREIYERFEVPEYWIIDEYLKKVTILRLDAQGKYREVRPRQGIVKSQVIKGFWIKIEWLWQESRPCGREALDEILCDQ